MERAADAHNAPILRLYVRLITQRVTLSAAPLQPFAQRCDFDRYASSLLRNERAYALTVGSLLSLVTNGNTTFPPLHLHSDRILLSRLGLKRAIRWEEIADATCTSVERAKRIKRAATLRFAILSRDLPDNLAEFGAVVEEQSGPFMPRSQSEAREIADFGGLVGTIVELVRMEAV